jgi:hypothetical protein
MHRPNFPRLLLAATAALLLAGCGGGDDDNRMKLSVADAPVDGATHVSVLFTGVELTGGSGPVNIDFAAPKRIDLITDSGTASAVLFDQPIPPGSYGQVRLKVVADGDPSNSYMDMADGTRHGLQVPSGDETGLKLVSGFDVPGSGVVAYTIDFDLRKAITCPPGQAPACTLKPAMRIVRDDSVGNIAGTVDPLLITDGCAPGVYVYEGGAVTPDDNGSATAPLASKVPVEGASGLTYQVTFLEPGDYTVAFTCDADVDAAETDDTVAFGPVESATVSAGQTTTVDLAPAAP